MRATPRPFCCLLCGCLLAAAVLAGCTLGDDTSPAPPAAFSYDASTRRYQWNASGDDGGSGFAVGNDIRISDHDLLSDPSPTGSFENLPLVHQQIGEGFPRVVGRAEFFLGERLDPTGYFHSYLQVRDEVGNGSAITAATQAPLAATNLAQLALLSGVATAGAVDAQGDVNGDGLSDAVAIDATAGAERLLVFLGRTALPYFVADVEAAARPDPVADTVGDCSQAPPVRLCSPDIVVDASSLGGLFGGSATAARPRSLATGDVDGDGFDEIVVGAPGFTVAGESQPRGAVFVLSFPQTLVSSESGRESLFFLYNLQRDLSYLGRAQQAGPSGLVVADLVPAGVADGVGVAAGADELQEWSLYEGEPVRGYRAGGSAIACGATECTGDDLFPTADPQAFETGDPGGDPAKDGITFDNLSGDLLLAIFDGSDAVVFAGVVNRFTRTAPGLRNRVELRDRRHIGTAPAAGPFRYALYERIASGERLVTQVDSGSPANPLRVGNLRAKYDAGNPGGTLVRLVDPTDPAVVPGPGQERPTLTLLGPEDDCQFGQSVAARGDLNFDGTSDLVVGAPALDSLPARLGSFATLADRGGVFVVLGGAELAAADVPAAGEPPDGVYDFGPGGADRPSSIILGRDAGENAGTALGAVRIRRDERATVQRDETTGLALALAVGAPGASPPTGDDFCTNFLGCRDDDGDDRPQAGAVYLFPAHVEFESSDPHPLATLADGIWDLDDDRPEWDVAPVEIWGAAAYDRLGASLAFDGDFNGDHVFDLAVGAPGANAGGGRIYVFLTTTQERTPRAFAALQASDPNVGSFLFGTFFRFATRGNLDRVRPVDDDANGIISAWEDRCIFCVYDLAQSFAATGYLSGPDLVIEGSASAAIGEEVAAGHLNADPYEELFFVIKGLSGDWPGFLNGLASTLVQYRQQGVFLPPERPRDENFGAVGTSMGSPAAPVTVPGNGGAVTWWVDRTVEGGAVLLGQVFIDVGAIYADTSTNAAATVEGLVFGRQLTDDLAAGPGTANTAQLTFLRRIEPDETLRWNVVTTGGLFAPGAGISAPFSSAALGSVSFGGDGNADGQDELLFFDASGELRLSY